VKQKKEIIIKKKQSEKVQKYVDKKKREEKVEKLSSLAFLVLRYPCHTEKKHNSSLTTKKHSLFSVKHMKHTTTTTTTM
jgi:hypothetical protein